MEVDGLVRFFLTRPLVRVEWFVEVTNGRS